MLLYWFHASPLNFIIYLIVWRCWVCIGQIIFQVHVVVKENRRRISLQTLPGVEAILHKDIAKIYRLSFHKFYITLSLLLSGNPFWTYKSDWMDRDECMSVKYDSWSRLLMLVQTPTQIYLTQVSFFLKMNVFLTVIGKHGERLFSVRSLAMLPLKQFYIRHPNKF